MARATYAGRPLTSVGSPPVKATLREPFSYPLQKSLSNVFFLGGVVRGDTDTATEVTRRVALLNDSNQELMTGCFFGSPYSRGGC